MNFEPHLDGIVWTRGCMTGSLRMLLLGGKDGSTDVKSIRLGQKHKN